MLTIPDTIKALYKKESVRKNYRIVFPNGEISDITNANLVQESVRFTESICSRETFRFGLAESSVLEFETVGISDMRGMMIQAFIEIDTTSLTTAQINAIVSDPGDGKIVKANVSTIGFGYYQIPLGVFVVASCLRDHEIISHRKVTAYSRDFFGEPNIFEQTKMGCPIPVKDFAYSPYVAPLVLSQLAWDSDAILISEGFTRTTKSNTTSSVNVGGIEISVKNNSNQTLKLKFTSGRVQHTLPLSASADDYRTIIAAYYSKTNIRNWIAAWDTYLESLDINYSAGATVAGTVSVDLKGVADLRDLLAQQFQVYGDTEITATGQKELCYNILKPFAVYKMTYDGATTMNCNLVDFAQGISGFVSFYTFGMLTPEGDDNPSNAYGHLVFPKEATLSIQNTSAGTTTSEVKTVNALSTSYAYAAPANYPLWDYRLAYSATGNDPAKSSFIGSYDIYKLINDYLELRGMFAAPSRTNSVDVFHLTDSVNVPYTADDYRSFWWDEYAGQNVGIIRYVVKIGDEDTVIDYRFGNGPGIYDLSDNQIFRNCGMTRDDAVAFLLNYLVPNIENMDLDTIDMECRGFPWAEPRDYLQVASAAGNTFHVYMTRRTLSGIQILDDQIDAVGNTEGGGQNVNRAQATVTAQSLSPDVVVSSVTSSAVATIGSGSTQSLTAALKKAGYLPVGIIGYDFAGSGVSTLNVYRLRIDNSDTAYMAVRNTGSGAASNVAATFNILWKRV